MTKVTIQSSKTTEEVAQTHAEGNYYIDSNENLYQLVYTGKVVLIEVKTAHWCSEGLDVPRLNKITQELFDKICGLLVDKLTIVKQIKIGFVV